MLFQRSLFIVIAQSQIKLQYQSCQPRDMPFECWSPHFASFASNSVKVLFCEKYMTSSDTQWRHTAQLSLVHQRIRHVLRATQISWETH